MYPHFFFVAAQNVLTLEGFSAKKKKINSNGSFLFSFFSIPYPQSCLVVSHALFEIGGKEERRGEQRREREARR